MTTETIMTKRCFHCGEHGWIEVSTEGVDKYKAGAFVQEAFPELDKTLREQIISGTHPKCWEEMFAPFDNVCDECDEPYEEDKGDGYCGLCPSCADKEA